MKIDDLKFKFENTGIQKDWELEARKFEKTLTAIEDDLAIPVQDNPSAVKASLVKCIVYIHNLAYIKPRADRYLKVAIVQQKIFHREVEEMGEQDATEAAEEDCIPILYLIGTVESVWKGLKDAKAAAKTYLGMEYSGKGID